MYCIQFDTSFIDGSLQLSSSFSSSVKIMNLSPAGCPQGSCISPHIKHKNPRFQDRGFSYIAGILPPGLRGCVRQVVQKGFHGVGYFQAATLKSSFFCSTSKLMLR